VTKHSEIDPHGTMYYIDTSEKSKAHSPQSRDRSVSMSTNLRLDWLGSDTLPVCMDASSFDERASDRAAA
jgi:hypothetical protein